MSLYDRDFSGTQESAGYQDLALVSFIKTTYKLFAGSLLLATIAALIGIQFVPFVYSIRWVLFIAEIGLILYLGFKVKDHSPTGAILLGVFAFISGLTIVPLLAYIVSSRGGLYVVVEAFAMSTIIFGIMSVYAIKTKSDLGNMGKMLFWSLIVVIIGSVVNIFLGSSLLQVGIAGASTIIFSLYIAYDTQNIIRGRYTSPVMAALALYLDFFNLFVSLLQILGIFGGSSSSE